MLIEVECQCGRRFAAARKDGGKSCNCPGCGGALIIPRWEDVQSQVCNYCHQRIPIAEIDAHEAQHTKLRADGQQTDYATLPSYERAPANQLAVEPRWYLHNNCGGVTGMPDDVMQTYLVNPWFYMSDRMYCTGCQKHVRQRECVWQETGENMQSYFNRLRAAKPETRPSFFLRALAWFLSEFRS